MLMGRVEAKRGRPALTMTPLRQRVYDQLCATAAAHEKITLGGIVRACKLHDKSSAKRIIRDLWKMGVLD